MTDSSSWPANYFSSRDRFLELAHIVGARTQSHALKSVGPDGQPLFVDVAALTSTDDEHRIVIASGVHGVEGFIGACIQLKALQKLAYEGIPERTGIVMIHAVNAWGFSHLRRVDENNADVNRNFINAIDSAPVSPAQYAGLNAVINPCEAPAISGEIRYWLNAGKLIAQNRGIRKLFKPIAEGQYDFPKGLFFGGFNVGEPCELLQRLVLEHSAEVGRISILDVHSGLGPPATATLISSSNIMPPEQQMSWLHTHYQQPVLIDNANVNVYNAQGTFSQWCQQTLSNKSFLYLCVEMGTVNPIRLFSALRRENQAHHWSASSSRSYRQTKQALLEVFAPSSPRWRADTVAQGLHVFEKTISLSAT